MAASKPAAVPDGPAADPPAAVAPPVAAAAPETPTVAAPEPASAPEADPAAPEPRGPGVYEYVGETGHTFLPQGFPPQSAGPGDVCELGWSPGDDPRWQPTGRPVTRWPDNDERAGAPAVHDGVTDVAHTEAERATILARLGIDPAAVKED